MRGKWEFLGTNAAGWRYLAMITCFGVAGTLVSLVVIFSK